jgi:hypothetical protein
MSGRISSNASPGRKEGSDDRSYFFLVSGKRSFVLFSAAAAVFIWFATFTVLISFTELPIIYNKLICVLAVLTFWMIRWYRNINQYIRDSKLENRIFARLRSFVKYSITEIFHFMILFSVLMILMIFVEKYF